MRIRRTEIRGGRDSRERRFGNRCDRAAAWFGKGNSSPLLLREQCRRVARRSTRRFGPPDLTISPNTCANGSTTDTPSLYEELRTRGYRGSYGMVRDYLRPLRTLAPRRTEDKFRRSGESLPGYCVTEDNLTDDEQVGRAGLRQLPALRSNRRVCHFVRGDAHRTPWCTIKLMSLCRLDR